MMRSMMKAGAGVLLAMVLVVGVSADNDGPLTLQLLSSYTAPPFSAKCLDGTPPAYYYRKGVGESTAKWILFFEGGGWCFPNLGAPGGDSCVSRSTTPTGTSKNYPPTIASTGYEGGEGFLSGSNATAGQFADWNVVYMKYCDGGSFTGAHEGPATVGDTTLYYRGRSNLDAMLHDLKTRFGLGSAAEVVTAGCSAGGMACYLHCDYIAEAVAPAKASCVCDAGMFLDVISVANTPVMGERFSDVVKSMNSSLPKRCVSAEADPSVCIFSQNALAHLVTPTFMINSLYNFFVWSRLTTPQNYSVPATWDKCAPSNSDVTPSSYAQCTESQKGIIQDWRKTFMQAAAPVIDPSTPHGCFLDSCPSHHCQTSVGWNNVVVDDMLLRDAVQQWYFEGKTTKLVDAPFPGNPSCPDGLSSVSV